MCITAQCPDPTEVGIWWRDDASWKLYSKDSMRAILQALLEGNTSLQLDLFKSSDLHRQGGASYLIDLSKMEQTNKHSGHKRAIKLILPSSFHATYRREPLGALQGFSVVRFRMCSSNCLLVIYLGNIVEWKVDGKVDAVVNPCSARVSSQRIGKGESLKSTQTLEELPIISSHMKGSVFDNGRSLRSIQNSGKIVPMSDQTEQAHGSVAAALHQAAGPKLQVALQKSVHFASGEGRSGDAVITPGFELPASHVVHSFAPPVYRKHDEAVSISKLEKAYKSALSLAALNGIRYIAFPAISCGAGGFPLQLAARVALETTSCNSKGMLEIHFVLLGQKALLAWVAQAGESFSRV